VQAGDRQPAAPSGSGDRTWATFRSPIFPPDCRAALLFYPALYEGFGLPVAQAMACGVPAITSRGSALEEIGGKDVVTVEPHRIEEMAAAVERLRCRRVCGPSWANADGDARLNTRGRAAPSSRWPFSKGRRRVAAGAAAAWRRPGKPEQMELNSGVDKPP